MLHLPLVVLGLGLLGCCAWRIPTIDCNPTIASFRAQVQPALLALVHGSPLARSTVDFILLDWSNATQSDEAALVLDMAQAEGRRFGLRWIVRLPSSPPSPSFDTTWLALWSEPHRLDDIHVAVDADANNDDEIAASPVRQWVPDGEGGWRPKHDPPHHAYAHRPTSDWRLFVVATPAPLATTATLQFGVGDVGDDADRPWTPMLPTWWEAQRDDIVLPVMYWLEQPDQRFTMAAADAPWPGIPADKPGDWPIGYGVWAAWVDKEYLINGRRLLARLRGMPTTYELTATHIHVLDAQSNTASPLFSSSREQQQ